MLEQKKFNTLYISYDGLYDQLGYSQILPYVKVITRHSNVTILSFEKKRSQQRKVHIDKEINDNQIKHIKLKFTKKLFFFLKFFDILKILVLPIYLNLFNNYNYIHCRGHIPAFGGILIKKIFRNKKFIFDCRGFWADERLDNDWNLSNFIHLVSYKLIKFYEKRLYKECDELIVLTNKAKEIIIKDFNINEKKIHVIPCVTNYKKFFPLSFAQNNELKTNLKLNYNHFIVGYFGSLNSLYMPNEMFYFFGQLLKRLNGNVTFLIGTNDSFQIDKFLEKKFQKNIIIKNINPINVNKYINICDLTLCFVRNTYARQASCPTKVAESLACGVPIICNSNVGDLNEIMKKIDKRLLVDANDKYDIQKSVISILNNRFFDKEEIISLSKKYFDLENVYYIYEKIYN